MKNALVCNAGGFIGSHLVKRLTTEGIRVRGVDLKFHYLESEADDFVIGELRGQSTCRAVIGTRFFEAYQLAQCHPAVLQAS